PQLTSRRQPQQARSADLVSIILQAASEVLANAGAGRFTTARVAERAGVSVGSVYQYFPNKAAILFRLQSDEWTRTADRLSAILA
ncbi:helix-turn-helix domain-containing protein, partial [Citrobacter europaeus]|uniref:helix-turn-helix domain-containing protein n=1 Tax=Citrobacter europaeus TaxID=1914243 RepID=UPI003EDA51B6